MTKRIVYILHSFPWKVTFWYIFSLRVWWSCDLLPHFHSGWNSNMEKRRRWETALLQIHKLFNALIQPTIMIILNLLNYEIYICLKWMLLNLKIGNIHYVTIIKLLILSIIKLFKNNYFYFHFNCTWKPTVSLKLFFCVKVKTQFLGKVLNLYCTITLSAKRFMV